MTKVPVAQQLMTLAQQLADSVRKGKVQTDTIENGFYKNETSEVDDYFLDDPVAIIDVDLFDGLSAHACRLLLNIIKVMGRNNIFYTNGGATANERRSLAELKRRGILLPTERKALYIINPFKLRRGKPMATIMASLAYYYRDNSVKLLPDLRPPKRALIQ